jgi:hypothetical protein
MHIPIFNDDKPGIPGMYMKQHLDPIAPSVVLSSNQYTCIIQVPLAMNTTHLKGKHKDSNGRACRAYQEPVPILRSMTLGSLGPIQHWLGMDNFLHASLHPVRPPLDPRPSGRFVLLSYDDNVNASSPKPQGGENATPVRELIITISLLQ